MSTLVVDATLLEEVERYLLRMQQPLGEYRAATDAADRKQIARAVGAMLDEISASVPLMLASGGESRYAARFRVGQVGLVGDLVELLADMCEMTGVEKIGAAALLRRAQLLHLELSAATAGHA